MLSVLRMDLFSIFFEERSKGDKVIAIKYVVQSLNLKPGRGQFLRNPHIIYLVFLKVRVYVVRSQKHLVYVRSYSYLYYITREL